MTSEFERELRRAKEEQRRQEEAGRRADQEEIRQQQLNNQSKETQRREIARREYHTYVSPVKPMVDRLIQGVANQTWGGSYGMVFLSGAEEFNQGRRPIFQVGNGIATWVVGRIGNYVPHTGPPVQYRWRAALDAGSDRDWSTAEYFSVSLQKMDTDHVNFNVHGIGSTSGTDERELREFLKQAFLKGPLGAFRPEPHFKEGG